jgi:glycosyltransferase involved in cell wall biosynthesis
MKIAQIATLNCSVGPRSTASVESLIWNLSLKLQSRGHEITVFGIPSDDTRIKVVGRFRSEYAKGATLGNWQLCEWMNLCDAITQSEKFDILHSHPYLFGMPLEQFSKAPILHTFHVWPHDDEYKLLEHYPSAHVSALSRAQWDVERLRRALPIVQSGVEDSDFTATSAPGKYLAFLGRFIPQKGPLEALEIAKKLGLPIKFAGPANDYLRDVLLPKFTPGSAEYVGMLQGKERSDFLGGALALVYPLLAPEPFGLVIVEALMCGTPIAALRLGAVPELVRHEENGILGDSIEELVNAAHLLPTLNRNSISENARRRHSVDAMADNYMKLYEAIIDGDTDG